jgi:hypothetical protein
MLRQLMEVRRIVEPSAAALAARRAGTADRERIASPCARMEAARRDVEALIRSDRPWCMDRAGGRLGIGKARRTALSAHEDTRLAVQGEPGPPASHPAAAPPRDQLAGLTWEYLRQARLAGECWRPTTPSSRTPRARGWLGRPRRSSGSGRSTANLTSGGTGGPDHGPSSGTGSSRRAAPLYETAWSRLAGQRRRPLGPVGRARWSAGPADAAPQAVGSSTAPSGTTP